MKLKVERQVEVASPVEGYLGLRGCPENKWRMYLLKQMAFVLF